MRVLIVGAGPTGLTVALELARYGVRPEIIEKRAGPSILSRAVGIMPESSDRLRPSGVGEAILREGMPFQKVEFHRGTKRLLRLDFSKAGDNNRTLIGLAQDRTETLMRDALRGLGVEVRYSRIAADIETDSQRALVTFGNGERDEFDWVIAADGAHSTIRQKLGIAFPGYELKHDWSIADVELNGGYDPTMFSAWLTDDGGATIIAPIERKRVRVISATPDAIQSLPIALDIRQSLASGSFKISVRQAETYRKGRVLLAGDAAHCHSPVGGRGMNLGIADAVAVANAILTGTTDGYSAERHAIGARVIRFTEAARKFLMSTNKFVRFLLWLAFRLVDRLPILQRALLPRMTQL